MVTQQTQRASALLAATFVSLLLREGSRRGRDKQYLAVTRYMMFENDEGMDTEMLPSRVEWTDIAN